MIDENVLLAYIAMGKELAAMSDRLKLAELSLARAQIELIRISSFLQVKKS